MKNSLFLSASIVIAALLFSSSAFSQTKTGAGQPSPESMAHQWQNMPAQTRMAGLEKLIARCREQASVETDPARRERITALIDAAGSLKADSANTGLLNRFFALYLDFKAPAEAVSGDRQQDVPVPGARRANETGDASVIISPKNLLNWTGTIHSSWFDGYVKSDGEIWAGDNIIATHFRGWVAFDLSPIPAGASISGITLNVWTSVRSNSGYHALVICAPVDNCDPRTADGGYLYACMASNNWFTGTTSAMQTTGGKALYLNSSACADLQRRIGHYNWWALGIFESGDDDDWGVFLGHDSNLRPTCAVAYTVTSGAGAAMATPPVTYGLLQNYPNPFNPSTTVQYSLPQRSRVLLAVYNTLGERIATLVNGEEEAGLHEARFDGTGLASGFYFYRLQAGSFVKTMKMLLTR